MIAYRKLVWVPNLRWFLPHRFAISLDRLSHELLQPSLNGYYLQFALALYATAARDVHYYLEPKQVSFWEENDVEEYLDEEHSPEPPLAPLVGYHSIGTLNGIVVWRTHQPRVASIPEERIAMSSVAVARPTTIILGCAGLFVVLAVLLFWISLTATELGAASQQEHGYGALFMLALGAPTFVLTLIYRASWRRYWRQLLARGGRTPE